MKASTTQKTPHVAVSILKGVAPYVVPMLLMAAADMACAATTGTEFQATSDRAEGWVQGWGGKAIALFATFVGMGTAAFSKNMLATLSGVGVALGGMIGLSIISGTFTAVI